MRDKYCFVVVKFALKYSWHVEPSYSSWEMMTVRKVSFFHSPIPHRKLSYCYRTPEFLSSFGRALRRLVWANKNRRVSNAVHKATGLKGRERAEKEGEGGKEEKADTRRRRRWGFSRANVACGLREGCRNRRLESLRTLVPFSRPPHR